MQLILCFFSKRKLETIPGEIIKEGEDFLKGIIAGCLVAAAAISCPRQMIGKQ
jgi:hypothetical protein